MESTRIRIVLADDAEPLRALMRSWFELEDDFEVVGEATDGDEAVEAVSRHRPDVVLLDAMMPGTDGVAAIPSILRESPQTRIVLFSAACAQYEPAAVEAGAHLCLDKSADLTAVTAAIRDLCMHRLSA